MKPQSSTLIQRLGFEDPDRKSADHDAIQLWSFDNAAAILYSLTKPDRIIHISSVRMEVPICHTQVNYKAIVGYIDLVINARVITEYQSREVCVCVEIKGKLPSCGELLRQINFYRRYQHPDDIWLVISPDHKFQEVLRSHSIFFYKYQGYKSKQIGLFSSK